MPLLLVASLLADFASFGMPDFESFTELSEGRRRREGLFSAGNTRAASSLLAGKELAGNGASWRFCLVI